MSKTRRLSSLVPSSFVYRKIFDLLLAVGFFGTLACSGISAVSGQATSGGTGDTGTTGDSGSSTDTGFDALSSTESGLYEDGPIDLPVTIAKLDSVNADLITVTPTTGAAEDLSSPSFIKRLEAGEAGYELTGEAGAVNTEQATKVYGLNTTSGTSATAAVKDDGSFDFEIAAEEGEIVAIAPMIDDESQIGPPVYGDTATGVMTFATTNTNWLNTSQNVVVDAAGYTYFSITEDADVTYTLYRRNLDGTAVETIAAGIPAPIRFLSVSADNIITYITQDGKIYRVTGAAASLTTKTLFAEIAWDTPEELHDFGEALTDPHDFFPPKAKTFIASTGDIFFINDTNMNEESSIIQHSLLTHIDAATGTETELISTVDFMNLRADVGSGDNLYVSLTPANTDPATYTIYKLDMSAGAGAWNQRTELHAEDPGTRIESVDVSVADLVVFTACEDGAGGCAFKFFAELEINTIVTEMFTSDSTRPYSEWAVVSPEGNVTNTAKVVTCRAGSEIGETGANYLVIHRVGYDAPNELYRITNSETNNSCSGAYRVDDAGRIVFYRAVVGDDGEEMPQLSFIDLDEIDESQLVLEPPPE